MYVYIDRYVYNTNGLVVAIQNNSIVCIAFASHNKD